MVRVKPRSTHRPGVLLASAVGFLSIVLGACSSSSASSSSTTVKKTTTTTTVPATTTTATASGGLLPQTACPYYPIESDGYGGVQENGVDLFFTVQAAPQNIWVTCQSQLKTLGWKIIKSGTNYSLTGSSIQATTTGGFAQIEIGSDPSVPTVSVCTWLSKPSDSSCPYGG